MKRSEVDENLRKICDLLFQKIIPSGYENSLSRPSSSSESSWIMNQASQLSYPEMDSAFQDNTFPELQDSAWGEKLEQLLIFSVALLTTYGIDIDEYLPWLKRNGDMFSPILLMFNNSPATEKEVKKLAEFVKSQYVTSIISAEDDVPSIVRFGASSKEEGAKSFKLLGSHLIYPKSTMDYWDLNNFFTASCSESLDTFWSIYANAAEQYNAFGDRFGDTITTFGEGMLELFSELSSKLFKALRSRKIASQEIQEFKGLFDTYSNECKLFFVQVLKRLVEKYVENAPEYREGEYPGLDRFTTYRHIRNLMDAPDSTDSLASKAAWVANDFGIELGSSIVRTFADEIDNSIRSSSYQNRIKKFFLSPEVKRLFNESMFFPFFADVREVYFDKCAVKDYGDRLVSKELPQKEFESLIENDCSQLTALPDKERIQTLKKFICMYPFSGNVHILCYRFYGDGAGDLQKIQSTFNINIDPDNWNKVENAFIKPLLSLPDSSFDEVVFAEKTLTNFKEKFSRYTGINAKLNTISTFSVLYNTAENALKIAKQNKDAADPYIIEGDDEKLWQLAEKGNGYAEYMLLRILQLQGVGRDSAEHNRLLQLADKSLIARFLAYELGSLPTIPLFQNGKYESWIYQSGGMSYRVLQYEYNYYKINAVQSKKKDLTILRELLTTSEKLTYPPAFLFHAQCLTEGLLGYPVNTKLAEEYTTIARTYGLK